MPQDRETMRRLVKTWEQAGVELDRIKWEELRALTEDDAVRMLELQHWPPGELWRSPERESAAGMVEQQRIFFKGYELSAHR